MKLSLGSACKMGLTLALCGAAPAAHAVTADPIVIEGSGAASNTTWSNQSGYEFDENTGSVEANASAAAASRSHTATASYEISRRYNFGEEEDMDLQVAGDLIAETSATGNGATAHAKATLKLNKTGAIEYAAEKQVTSTGAAVSDSDTEYPGWTIPSGNLRHVTLAFTSSNSASASAPAPDGVSAGAHGHSVLRFPEPEQ